MTNTIPKKVHRLRDPETNPCLKESDLTIKCFEEYHYEKNKCGAAFQNYNNCRAYWTEVMKQRRGAHIKPNMPGEKERNLIKAERDKGRKVISIPVDDS